MTLYRNANGDLFFHQPMENRQRGDASIATWHIDHAGESYLRNLDIGEGDRLPFGEFLYLRDCGHLYTLETQESGYVSPQKERPRFNWGVAVGLRIGRSTTSPHQPTKRKKKNKMSVKQQAQSPTVHPTRSRSSQPPQRRRKQQTTKTASQSGASEWNLSRETALTEKGIHSVWTAEKPTSKKR